MNCTAAEKGILGIGGDRRSIPRARGTDSGICQARVALGSAYIASNACPEIGPSRARNGEVCESAMCLRRHLEPVRCRGAFQTTLHTLRQANDVKFSARRLVMNSRDEQEVGH